MEEKIRVLKGGNLDIDLIPKKDLTWNQDKCPWSEAEGTDRHKCAVKDISICKHFRGIKVAERPDIVLCAFPEKNKGSKR